MLHTQRRQTLYIALLLLLGLCIASDHPGGALERELEFRRDQAKQQLQARNDQIAGEEERAEMDLEKQFENMKQNTDRQREARKDQFQRQHADAQRQYEDQLAQIEREFENRKNNDSGNQGGDHGGDQGGDHPVTPDPSEEPTEPVEPWQPETSVEPLHGALNVKGNKIVNEAGEPVRLRGMALFWSQWMGKFYNADAVKFMAEEWGVTLIRASMAADRRFQGADSGYLYDPVGEAAKVDAVVQACVDAGIYCIIDWHAEGDATRDTNTAKNFFGRMAQKYGHLPNVFFEPWNEPTQQSWDRVIKPYHEVVVEEIRKHTNNICILGNSTWSQDMDVASRNPVEGENLAYTLHFYAGTHRQGNRDKVQTCLDNGHAVVCTEWGTCDASGNGALDLEEAQKWMDFLEENHISDANWSISDKNETAAAIMPSANPAGPWSDADLTRSGRWVRDSIKRSAGKPAVPVEPTQPENPHTPVEPSQPSDPQPSSPPTGAVEPWNAATAAPEGSAVATHGALSVKGNRLVDSAGEPVRLQGMALFWSQWMGKYYNASAIKFMAENWGVNLIRASMAADGRFQGKDSGYLFDPVGEAAKVDAAVQGCVEAGIYCIIDWHTEGDSDLSRAKPFFAQMAQKYGHLPNVMFEPWNEPIGQNWDSVLKPYHEAVVGEIRKHSNNVCILGSSTWSQDCDIASKNPLKEENVAYTVHFYAGTHKEWNRSKVQTALDNGCAVVCTEWGTCDSSGNGALDLPEAQKWMDFFEQNYISSANWALSDKNETSAALNAGASPAGQWTDADLTRSGQWVRDYIKKSAAATRRVLSNWW